MEQGYAALAPQETPLRRNSSIEVPKVGSPEKLTGLLVVNNCFLTKGKIEVAKIHIKQEKTYLHVAIDAHLVPEV